ncbi:15762_t:CDS:2, partial [Funneliformis geosporum]
VNRCRYRRQNVDHRRIIDSILAIVIHRIIDHVPAIDQGIVDPISEDTERSHILHEGK